MSDPTRPGHPETSHRDPTASQRSEKLSALAALLGPEALARLRARDGDFAVGAPAAEAGNLSPDRLAWHQNRILQRVRARGLDLPDKPVDTPPAPPSAAEPAPRALAQPHPGRPAIDMRLVAGLDPERLADEHPAVIARLLRGMDREARIAALRDLPGAVARSVVRRLKAD